MKVFGIVVVRNEADVIRLSILHHLALGLDCVLVIDNGSSDGTLGILEQLHRDDPRVHWWFDPGPFRQVSLRTVLARTAYWEGADWVVPFDADEFWWVDGGDLRAVLAASDAGALRAEMINFVQRRDRLVAAEAGLSTMTRRPLHPVAGPLLVADRQLAYVEEQIPAKVISRPTMAMVIEPGNHSVAWGAGPPADEPRLAVLHAPLRSRACLQRKADHGERALAAGSSPELSWHLKRWVRLRAAGELDAEWAANSYVGTTLDVYTKEHPLIVDERLREAVAPFLPHIEIIEGDMEPASPAEYPCRLSVHRSIRGRETQGPLSNGSQSEADTAPSVFFSPDRPGRWEHLIEQLRQFAGWELASGPESADWCVLFRDATWVTLAADDPLAQDSATWINGRCRDVSKRTVERIFAAVFGYPLAIDPLTHQGPILRKSDMNFTKDAMVLHGPIPAAEIDERYVYERLIDSRVPGLGALETRAFVVRGTILPVKRTILTDWISTGRLDTAEIDSAIVYPDTVFSPQEQERIAAFCDAIGLDFGALDIIRDNADGRIYIVDANNTPGQFLTSGALNAWRLEQLARAFVDHFPSRRTTCLSILA